MSAVRHAPGTFCWVELATTDAAAAKRFYTTLFGWDADDLPGGFYTMLRLHGGDVGGLYALTPEMRAQGVASHWLSYVSVESSDAAARRAADLGVTILKDAFDVMDVGRMAALQDPAGAAFAVWQPRAHHGATHTDGRVGTVCWNELVTTDVMGARRFYSDLFGWKPKVHDGPAPYHEFHNRDRAAAGMMAAADVRPHWLVYFAVDDCDAAAKQTVGLGGCVMVPAQDVPRVGRFAVLSDPLGAAFAVIHTLRAA